MAATISDVRMVTLHKAVPQRRQHTTEAGRVETVAANLVFVESDDGQIGIGEAYGSGGVVGAIIERDLKPLLVGEDPDRIEYLWEKMYSRTRVEHALKWGRGMPAVRRGADIYALSGTDIALWDLKGKRYGVPTYELLGGKCRDRILAHASGGWARPGGPCAEEIGAYAAKGFKAVKMRVGLLDDSAEQSAERVEEAREAIGPDVEIALEGHGALDYRSAKELAELVEPFDIAWFEDPCSADNKRQTAELRSAVNMKLAGGKNDQTRFDFRDYIELDALDIFTPGPAIAGGITECKRIADMASAWNMKVSPHNWGSAFLFGAVLQLVAAMPNAYRFEFCQAYQPFLYELANEPVEVGKDGFVAIPDDPAPNLPSLIRRVCSGHAPIGGGLQTRSA